MPPKKEAPKKDWFVEVGFVLLVILFIWVLWSIIIDSIFGDKSWAEIWQIILDWFKGSLYPALVVICIIASLFLILGVFSVMRKLMARVKAEKEIFGNEITPSTSALPLVEKKNEKWEQAMIHLHSPNAGDWRLAIIEADVILDDMLRAMGYHGDSIGDMLKGVDRSEMLTLDAAWEAHKVRNEIVHSASEYQLTEREAKRVMSLYEAVFKEFKII